MVKSDFPSGIGFSPSQIDLVGILKIAKDSSGNWKKFERKVREKYFENYKTSDYNKGKLANNCKLGMIAYGLIDRDSNLTDVGNKLLSLQKNVEALYESFAKHILLNKKGLILVRCITDIYVAGEIDLNRLRERLAERGLNFPRGGKHADIMRLWLEKAGVFELNSWRVNERRLHEIVGGDCQTFAPNLIMSINTSSSP